MYSPAIHRERRKFLRSALKELALIFTDQPGLLGPKVRESKNKTNTKTLKILIFRAFLLFPLFIFL